MIRNLQILFLSLFFCAATQAQPLSFIENKGQWADDFDFKLPLGQGAVFLNPNSVTVNLAKPVQHVDIDSHQIIPSSNESASPLPQDFHAYRVSFEGASDRAVAQVEQRRPGHYNYIHSNDPARWKAEVGRYGEVAYEDVYPGIDLKYYFSKEGNLKYDVILEGGADPEVVKLRYEGADGLELKEGNLVVKTSLGEVLELAPFAYQWVEGKRQVVECSYVLKENILSFELGRYDRKERLVIDPKLIFSSYTGSTANNFGFTATFSSDGGLYAGGVAYSNGSYPVTLGAYQIHAKGGDVDMAISKFSADGTTLLYSTYLGGSESELPYSLFEGKDKSLIIFGTTGSTDYPVSNTAYSSIFKGGQFASFFASPYVIDFPFGSDAFITKLDSTGGQLLASTYFGGTNNEGFNYHLNFNYGDVFRGDVISDSTGGIFAVSSTISLDLPTTASSFMPQHGTLQDGFVCSFNSDLSILRWASYVGGNKNDNALSLRMGSNQRLYVAGGTQSTNIPFAPDAYQAMPQGEADGYILALDVDSGSFVNGTYNGTTGRDLNYCMDIDYQGEVYVFGQSRGNYPVSDSVYKNAGSAQFLHKFSPDLKTSRKSTVFGSGEHTSCNISPTAFMVDDCRNLYLSGWGGGLNKNYQKSSTHGMPVTENAFQKNTDGNDFYFLVLDATWKKINYASFFGGTDEEHVDGGTSRFAPDGTIYQAVCGGCFGDFPTTTNAHARLNTSGSCNLAAIKMQFEAREVVADAAPDIDSSCVPYTAHITNTSYNGDIYRWRLPNGSYLKGNLDSVVVSTKGPQSYWLTAIDTTCGFIDSTELVLHGFKDSVYSAFTANFDSCSNDFYVNFVNLSDEADEYFWDFGDGQTSMLKTPFHRYTEPGSYQVKLYTKNTYCALVDSAKAGVKFKKRILSNDFDISYMPCKNGTRAEFSAIGTGFQKYIWSFGTGGKAEGQTVNYDFEKAGTHTIHLDLVDTICQRYLSKDTSFTVYYSGYEPQMANVFTPNGDGINDYFGFPKDLPDSYVNSFSMKIYNRWGGLLYETASPADPWNGKTEATETPEGVYFYILNFSDDCDQQKEYKGYVHLSK